MITSVNSQGLEPCRLLLLYDGRDDNDHVGNFEVDDGREDKLATWNSKYFSKTAAKQFLLSSPHFLTTSSQLSGKLFRSG